MVRMVGPTDVTNVADVMVRSELWESRAGVAFHMTPDLPGVGGTGILCRARNVNRYADEVVWVGGSGLVSYIKYNDWPAQLNKEGAYADPYPHAVATPELREYSDV